MDKVTLTPLTSKAQKVIEDYSQWVFGPWDKQTFQVIECSEFWIKVRPDVQDFSNPYVGWVRKEGDEHFLVTGYD